MALIELDNLTYYYPARTEPALWQVNASIEAGEFVLLMGRSGSGKSSLLQAFNRLIPDFHGGRMAGEISYKGIPLRRWESRDLYREMGMVFQNPDLQLLFGSVERDIAFGMENLGLPGETMRRRIAEVSELIKLDAIRERPLSKLSGGEKQKAALAGVLAMCPSVLLLDEPAAHLDPVSSADFFAQLKRLQENHGFTIVMAEQCIHQCLPIVDRVLIMDQGMIVFDGKPRAALEWMAEKEYPLCPVLPSVFAAAGQGIRPLTILEGRKALSAYEWEPLLPKKSKHRSKRRRAEGWLQVEGISYTYPGGSEALRKLTFSLERGEILGLVGSNGAGKSTLLKLLMGILKPQAGQIRYPNEVQAVPAPSGIGYLPQQLKDYFVCDTLQEDLSLGKMFDSEYIESLIDQLSLSRLLNEDPRTLSGGEQQRAALACLFAEKPQLVLLDEPVQGMDEEQKQNFGRQLRVLSQSQATASILVSHDMDFVTEYADRILFLHQGRLLAEGPVSEVLGDNVFYRSQVGLLFRDFDNRIHTRSAAIQQLEGLIPCKSTGVSYQPSS